VQNLGQTSVLASYILEGEANEATPKQLYHLSLSLTHNYIITDLVDTVMVGQPPMTD